MCTSFLCRFRERIGGSSQKNEGFACPIEVTNDADTPTDFPILQWPFGVDHWRCDVGQLHLGSCRTDLPGSTGAGGHGKEKGLSPGRGWQRSIEYSISRGKTGVMLVDWK